jgi:hypothetical protein
LTTLHEEKQIKLQFFTMKIAALLLAVMAVSSKSIASANIDVEIIPDCANLDLSTLSSDLLAFSANALEDAFNEAHADNPNSDKVLVNVHWYNQGDQLGQGGCQFYCGGEGCTLCPDDDAFAALPLTSGLQSATHDVWEQLYYTKMLAHPDDAFASIGVCSIDLHETAMDAEEEQVQLGKFESIQIILNCSKLDESRLTATELEVSSKALMDAFNAVHASDDKVLSNLHYVPPTGNLRRPSLSQLGQGGCQFYCGGEGCNICPNDDDSFTPAFTEYADNLERHSETHMEWIQQYVANVEQDSHAVFQDVGKCTIKMKHVGGRDNMDEVQM